MKAFFHFLNSLKLRVFVFVILTGLLPVSIALLIFVNSYETIQINNITTNLSAEALVINSKVVSSGFLLDPQTTNISIDSKSRVLIADKSMKIVEDTYGIYGGRLLIWSDAIRSSLGETVSNYDKDNGLVTLTMPVVNNYNGDSKDVLGVMAFMQSTQTLSQDIVFFKRLALVILSASLAILIILGLLFSYNVSRPLNKLKKQIDLLEDGNDAIFVKGYSEIEDISKNMDIFTKQLRKLDKARSEFVSNVSHELKTPLTSMKIMADSLNSSDEVPVEFYREFMSDITSEIDRETMIINDLLSIVRMEQASAKLNIETVNINKLIEDIMKKLTPLAQERDINLVLETFRPINVDIDEVKLSQALINLIENAIKYNNDGGWVHVSVNSDHQYCFIRVEDNGIGIPNDSLDDIFERFYRVDKSHSKEIEGTGLGLSIVRSIVQMHRGQIKVSSIENEGTTFSIRIPLIYSREEVR